MKYYAFLDYEDFIYFGEYPDYTEAIDAEIHQNGNTVWIFDEDSARKLLAKLKLVLEES